MKKYGKEELRLALAPAAAAAQPPPSSGKIAEQFRRLPEYRTSERVFIAPAALLHQSRINVLADRKGLIMPAPGLKEDFYLLNSEEIPFSERNYATSNKGLARFGHRVSLEELAARPVSLLLTDCLVVGENGIFLGEGKGFFDLVVAILAEAGALSTQAKICGAGLPEQRINGLITPDHWDVPLRYFLTGGELIHFDTKIPPQDYRIFWEALSPRRLRKITPLWKLSQRSRAPRRARSKSNRK